MPPITEADDPQIFRLLEDCKAMLPKPAMIELASALAIPTPTVTAPGDSEIMTLFRQLVSLRREMEAFPTEGLTDEDLDRLFFDPMDAIEDQLMKLPSTSAADLAAKMLVAHCFGVFSCLYGDAPVWTEAWALVGMKPYPKRAENSPPVSLSAK